MFYGTTYTHIDATTDIKGRLKFAARKPINIQQHKNDSLARRQQYLYTKYLFS